MIFHKQRGEARTVIAIKAIVRIGTFECDTTLTNASSKGILATMAEPPVRGTKVELIVGDLVLPGQVRWREAGCCGIALRDAINVSDLVEGGAVPVSYIPEPRRPRGPAKFLRAIVGH